MGNSTRCVLCKVRARCTLMDGKLVHYQAGDYVPCRDPEARGNKPSRLRPETRACAECSKRTAVSKEHKIVENDSWCEFPVYCKPCQKKRSRRDAKAARLQAQLRRLGA